MKKELAEAINMLINHCTSVDEGDCVNDKCECKDYCNYFNKLPYIWKLAEVDE